MHARTTTLLPPVLLILAIAPAVHAQPKQIDLAKSLAAGKLRAVNRDVSKLPDKPDAVHMSEKNDPGVVWIDGSDFTQGTIEIDVRGRDVLQRSFLGIAFHGKDDNTYEAVYLRPFNFRAQDPARHRHAVQYISLPDFDWPRLREQFHDEFEAPVGPSIAPSDWVPLRVVIADQNIQVFVGPDKQPALTARKLGSLNRGIIGLWTGNGSDGDFANLRITPAK